MVVVLFSLPLSLLLLILLPHRQSEAFLLFDQRKTTPSTRKTSISSAFLLVGRRNPIHWKASQIQQSSNENNENHNKMLQLIKVVGSTTSLVVGGSVFLAIAWYRNALTVSLFIGAVSNGILSKILKRLLQQERPITMTTESIDTNLPNDHGMPSSHAMSLGFIGMFTAWQFPSTAGLLIIYVGMSLFYRVRVKSFHTWEQIIVGFIIGSINGSLWWHWTNDPNSALIHWISDRLLIGENGLLPYSMLWIPLVVGGLTVSSFERKISSLLGRTKQTKANNNDKDS